MGLFGKKKEKSCCCGKVDASCANGAQAPARKGIVVLGTGCAKCHALEQVVREAAAELGLAEEVSYVTDIAQIAAYGVMTTPALVVDGRLVSYGKLLKKDEVKDLIEKAKGSHV